MTNGNQGTLLSTLTFPEFTDLVRHIWVEEKDKIVPVARQLFIFDPIGSGQGGTKRYDELDSDTFADYLAEGTDSSKAKHGVGYNVTMTARAFSKEVDITWPMRVQNRYQEVNDKITSLASLIEQRQELDLTHRLTFATSSSYTDKNGITVATTVGDGNVLAYATHALAFSSTTYSNRVTADPAFSESALEAAMNLATSNIYNNFGEKRVKNFNVIFMGENDQASIKSAQQLIRSSADPDAVQSGVTNVYMGKFRLVVLPYLSTTAAGAYDSTKKRWWGIAAVGQGSAGWQAYLGEWVAPELFSPSIGSNGEDIHNFNWTYSTRGMYGICTVSPKGIIFSCPTS